MQISTERKFSLPLLFLLTLLSSDGLSFQSYENDEPQECNFTNIIIGEVRYDNTLMRISRDESFICQAIEFFQSGKRIFREAEFGAHYFLGTNFNENETPLIPFFEQDEYLVAFSKWTGGAHCCYSLHLFRLSPVFQKVATIEGGNFMPEVIDLDQSGAPEILVHDDFLAYEFSSFASSAVGKVILKFSDETYRVAAEYMIQPPPDLNLYEKQIQKWSYQFEDEETGEVPPPAFIQTITNLVFSGNKEVAVQLLNKTWPESRDGKEEFWTQYEETLKSSRYYPDFEAFLERLGN